MPAQEAEMSSKRSPRRQFLKNGAALAGFAAGAISVPSGKLFAADTPSAGAEALHAYGERSHFENATRIGNIAMWPIVPGARRDYGFRTPLQDSIGIITPAPLHFIISHGHEPPDIDPRDERLMIHGLVDRPLIFSLDEIKRLPAVSRLHFLECHGNSATGGPTGDPRKAPTATVQDTHGLTSCSIWTGVPLSLLLSQVGVQKGASWIVAEGSETGKHSKSIPLEKAMDDCLVVYGQNGEALRPEQGYPLRLLVPGWQGINNVKWLRRIYVVDQPYMAMMESTKYPSPRLDGKSRWFEFELGPKSVITRPAGGYKMPGPGFHEITGLAWSGAGAIKRVEVSTDGGRTWKDAQLHDPIARKAHTRFSIPWTWDGKECVLQSRCTDDTGTVQPTVTEVAKLWNADVDFLKKSQQVIGDFNAIQPWKINSDGSVQNAIF